MKLKIAFFGSFGKFSELYLRALKEAGFEVILEIRDKNADFKKIEQDLKKNKPDLGVIAYFGKIIPKEILELAKYGFINAHPSLLPRWRGPSPIQTAILAGDKKTGITIHLATAKADSGPILVQKEIPIHAKDTYLNLTERLAAEGAAILAPTIKKWLSGQLKPKKQDDSKATYAKFIKKKDGQIDWSRQADYIEKMVRAYNPWPGTYTKMKNGKVLKIKKAEAVNGALNPLIVQPEGKKEMSFEAFLRGHREISEKHRRADSHGVFAEF